ncbi:MAG: tRNA-binding protein [Candidatus Marinimicrobia bacterium]|nr:tRNA-binding protein [Candidatus Neomarinimicrobiota bacterium]MBL7010555.1 tRNA-binding protein [Candidatus Neomarinimicrobiota bacterium]MBL7030506.1 tRNA-binding protein [Candidatus Neomarinimicrobiota bacterium]
MIDIKDFGKLALRVGTIELAENFPEANKPAYKLKIDFGAQGKKWSSAQITENYTVGELSGHRVMVAFNLGNKKIGPFTSEVLVLGAEDSSGNIVLLKPDGEIRNGALVN